MQEFFVKKDLGWQTEDPFSIFIVNFVGKTFNKNIKDLPVFSYTTALKDFPVLVIPVSNVLIQSSRSFRSQPMVKSSIGNSLKLSLQVYIFLIAISFLPNL